MDIPGFVDLQVNGFRGVDFSQPGLAEETLVETCRAVLGEGTAAFLATVITSPRAVYRQVLPVWARICRRADMQGRVLGLHLEGPFLNPTPGAVGAHDIEAVAAPDIAYLDELYELAAGQIRMLTVAADVPGAEELAHHARRLGIVVGLGHHLAEAADLDRLAQAGAQVLTHLGNALPNMIHRHHNPIWAGLAADDLTATIIGDGHHLPAALVKTMLRAKGVDRSIIISDAAPLAGMPPGKYESFGLSVVLEPSGYLHCPSRGCLAGSSATMLTCMNYVAKLGELTHAELMRVGFDNPLQMLGLTAADLADEAKVGYDEAADEFFVI